MRWTIAPPAADGKPLLLTADPTGAEQVLIGALASGVRHEPEEKQ